MKFFKTHLAAQIVFILYLIYSAFYKSLNPLKWSYLDSYFYLIIVAFISIPILISAYINMSNEELNIKFDSIFELSSFKNSDQKIVDYILGHYTNVATVGLFLMVIIYILKPYTKSIMPLIHSSVVIALISAAFFVYSLLLIRLGFYFSNLPKVKSVMIICFVTIIDFQAIDIFIKSTPH